jgi:hypothetical protein
VPRVRLAADRARVAADAEGGVVVARAVVAVVPLRAGLLGRLAGPARAGQIRRSRPSRLERLQIVPRRAIAGGGCASRQTCRWPAQRPAPSRARSSWCRRCRRWRPSPPGMASTRPRWRARGI